MKNKTLAEQVKSLSDQCASYEKTISDLTREASSLRDTLAEIARERNLAVQRLHEVSERLSDLRTVLGLPEATADSVLRMRELLRSRV